MTPDNHGHPVIQAYSVISYSRFLSAWGVFRLRALSVRNFNLIAIIRERSYLKHVLLILLLGICAWLLDRTWKWQSSLKPKLAGVVMILTVTCVNRSNLYVDFNTNHDHGTYCYHPRFILFCRIFLPLIWSSVSYCYCLGTNLFSLPWVFISGELIPTIDLYSICQYHCGVSATLSMEQTLAFESSYENAR